MAVGSGDLGLLHPVGGVRMTAVSAGIKKPGRKDVVLFEVDAAAVTAGVFTLNAFCAAPVTLAKTHLAEQSPRYLLINTGNANAGTGEPGLQAAIQCCEKVAQAAGVSRQQVLPFSTGVIGELLPADKVCAVIDQALSTLTDNSWEAVARGIMTTDTRPKAASRQVQLAGKTVTITGISKGAGMIKPNMATMLAYVFTDAELSQEDTRSALKSMADFSFNRITVDGDTSTNDSCMLVASGASGVAPAALSEIERQDFYQALHSVFVNLAQAIIRDAEGATKFVTVKVGGGVDSSECLAVAYAVAESPLVKTALFASDPNWGRILAATGRAGVKDLDVSKIDVFLDDVCIVSAGARAATYSETDGQAVFNREEFTIHINLGRGSVEEIVWTSDLSHDYVRINAEYRT